MTRRSKRVESRKAAAKAVARRASRRTVTPADNSRQKKQTASRKKSTTASTKQRPSSVANPSVTPPTKTKIIRNPYAKKKPPSKPPPPPPSPSPPPSPPRVDPFPPRDFYLPSSPEEEPDESTEEEPSLQLEQPVSTAACIPGSIPVPNVNASVPAVLLPNNADGSIDIEKFVAPTTDSFNIHGILRSIKENAISFKPGTGSNIKVYTNELTTNTTGYEKRKAAIKRDFFNVLSNHKQAAPLAELIQDPDNPAVSLPRLYVICRHKPCPHRKSILNWAIQIYSLAMVRVDYRGKDFSNDPIVFARAQYEPDTVKTMFKYLFAVFSSRYIPYSKDKDFNGPGEFQAYWKEVFRITAENRLTYGTQPNKSDFDEQWFEKRSAAAKDPSNPFNPFSNTEHFVWAALENIIWAFNLRGCKEPAYVVKEDFVVNEILQGDFAGLPNIRLKETHRGQKGQALSLKKSVINSENTRKKTYPCPYNEDPLSCYQTTKKLLEMIPPNCEETQDGGGTRIFRKPASEAQLAEWKAKGLPYKLSPKRGQVIGANRINPILKQIANWCGYTNPDRNTAHGRRRGGISKVANASGVGPANLVQLGGHASLRMVANYHKPNQQSNDAVVRAKFGSPTTIWNQLKANDPSFEDKKPSPVEKKPSRSIDDSPLPLLLQSPQLRKPHRDNKRRSPSPRRDRFRSPSPPVPRKRRKHSPLSDRSNRRYSSRRSPERRRYSSRSRSPDRRYSSKEDRYSSKEHRRYSSRGRSPDRRSPEDRRRFARDEYSSRRSPERRRYSSRSRSPDRRYSSKEHRRDSSRSRSPDRRYSSERRRSSVYRDEVRVTSFEEAPRYEQHPRAVTRHFDRYQQPHQQGYPPQQQIHQPALPPPYYPGDYRSSYLPPYQQNGGRWV